MKIRNLQDRFTDFVVERYLGAPNDFPVSLGEKVQKTSMFVPIQARRLWREEPRRTKVISLLKRQWTPQEALIRKLAQHGFMDDVFGTKEDFGDRLFRLNSWHQSQKWNFDALSPHDLKRAEALEIMTGLTRLRFSGVVIKPPLNLALADRAPDICFLVYPMVAKIPVISIQFFLNVHTTFAFKSIRSSGHPDSDNLIAYLYELLFLQQKIAIGLHEFVRLAAFTVTEKQQASFINAEVNAIMGADLMFSYLKASVEKTMALVGATHGVSGLDSKKTHKARLAALAHGLPPEVSNTPYCQFLMEFVASENLDELNSYRSGLLHKRGISDLQPHNYVNSGAQTAPFSKILGVLHEQHAKNTAVLLAALALLTDELVRRDPPSINIEDIPM